MELNDAELIAACRAGDAIAWDQLVSRYQQLIYSIARNAGLDQEQSADIFQLVFTKLIECLEQIEQPALLGSWLSTTARQEVERLLRMGTEDRSQPPALDKAIEATADKADRRPVKFVTHLLWTLPEEIRDVVIGDLEEEFYEKIDSLGVRQAHIWYNQQVISSVYHFAVREGQKRIKRRILGWISETLRRFTS
jgi:RNA polymerase sigma factor (sigma-70 family)